MTTFRDAAHLYSVLDPFFRRVSERPEIAAALLESGLVLGFRYTEPSAEVTLDLRARPLRWDLGPSALEPELTMIQSADTAHLFWLGKLSVPRALATRRIVARGPVAKALRLLPAITAAFPLYAEVLRETGNGALADSAVAAPIRGRSLREHAERAVAMGRDLFERLRGEPHALDLSSLDARVMPLLRGNHPAPRPFRDQPRLEGDALELEMLRRMSLVRAFEAKLSQAYAAGEVPTEAIHLSIGQEASAVGVCFALRADDFIATTHRGHGHMLAKGADLDGMMAEMLAKASGLCGGKGGSMHVTDASVGAIGANGIVGASPLMAAGAAHSAKLRGSAQVAVAFLGDGATNQGMFHEALNFAATLDLPAVFVVENNLYGEFTPLSRHCRVARIADRAAAYGMPGHTVDGNDVLAVHRAARDAVERARRGEGPTLLECLTYRWHGHMEGESVPYRPAEEIAAWRARCPIAAHARRLASRGVIDEAGAQAITTEAQAAVERAYRAAQAADAPAKESLETDVFAPDPPELWQVRAIERAPALREITYSRALFEALAEELARDESVYLLGEDVTTGGYFAVTVGLAERFAGRIVDTPISEYAIVGSAVGAAMTGRRPIAEILFSDFLTTCMDPIVNQAAKLRYMSGGQYELPLVVRTPGGAGLGMAAQHSQSLEALFSGIPGLIVVAPATPRDAKGLLKAAIRSNNPVLFFENKVLYAATGPVPDDGEIVPLGLADVKRRGEHATIVSVGAILGSVREAAETLEREGIRVEVVDVRTLAPLDVGTIVRSVARTGRLVTAEEGPHFHGFGAEVVARVCELAFSALRAAPQRVAALDVPIPYASALEMAAIPSAESIAAAVRRAMRTRR